MMEFYDAVYTVSQLNRYLKNLMDSDPFLQTITVKGELSNFTHHMKSGHFYFSVKDGNCSIKGVMFRAYAQRVRFRPENGMNVILTGSVRLFERDGALQFYCEHMEPDGIGALTLAFEQLKKRLAEEGLFAEEHKKPLPRYPKRIGVVTSKTGAALQDILNILSRRYPVAMVVLIPALVQGENAADSICAGIRAAEKCSLDVLIVGRGGGSAEDLWCFNEERVARAIYECTVPVISAVGHEIDFTISDFAADLRAPTPSAAAELCAPDLRDMLYQIKVYESTLDGLMETRLDRNGEALRHLARRLAALSPEARLLTARDALQSLRERLEHAADQRMKQKRQHAQSCMAMLEALNPLKVLSRGYSVTYSGDKILTGSGQVCPGDRLRTLLANGEIESTVELIRLKEKG